ncbi:cation diffusion facilitator family transporter [Planococcus sp. N028]|uniref:Cation diffusion facilitator family transporter n=1 Tax=Planococcus shixiaomingii TaxID=3058393 RepID=A0ABT8MZA8_9BACL|nr:MULTISPECIES: cation diffusion facilitator family transporter [unclassified Planococcus (in: firmicutes)]MDN7240948.1 cation diffusion facilitator family transporter [Planococcus sp. N028]WKA53203.1 cation diffusion facilitator family transporter [Planococcus sp. N022]
MEQERYDNLKLGEKGAILSIVAYILLSILKLFVGYTANSEALLADGLNNMTDIVASVAVLIGLKLSQKPADDNHPYGHWRAETIAALVASFIMMAVGLQVVYSAVVSVFEGSHQAPDMIAAWTGIFSAFVMYFVYRYNKNLANKINSQAVKAAAKDNLSDAWVSIAAVAGIIGAQFYLTWLDPLTAVLVGFLICKTAWGIFWDATHDLTDGFDEELIKSFKDTALRVYGVKGVKDIRARNYGNNAVVDLVLLVRSDLDIRLAHDISTEVEKELMNTYDISAVHVHVEPN